jgi:hypothetical protein
MKTIIRIIGEALYLPMRYAYRVQCGEVTLRERAAEALLLMLAEKFDVATDDALRAMCRTPEAALDIVIKAAHRAGVRYDAADGRVISSRDALDIEFYRGGALRIRVTPAEIHVSFWPSGATISSALIVIGAKTRSTLASTGEQDIRGLLAGTLCERYATLIDEILSSR